MQCPLPGCFVFSPKVIFLVIALPGFVLGVVSAFRPERSIAFYQRIMKHFNWRAEPIDAAKELRNTRVLGLWLAALNLALAVFAGMKF